MTKASLLMLASIKNELEFMLERAKNETKQEEKRGLDMLAYYRGQVDAYKSMINVIEDRINCTFNQHQR